MVEAFAAADLPLFVAYYRRRLPSFLKVAELIRTGALGRLTGVTYRLAEPHHRRGYVWRTDVALAGSGHFLDLASHALDLLDFLLGPLTLVSGSAANLASDYDAEDMVALTFRTAGCALGAMTCNFAAAVRDDTMRITGSDGEVTFPMFRSAPLKFETAAGTQEFDLPYPPHVAQPLIQSLIDDLLGRGDCPSTGESALRTSRLMDQALEAYYGGRDDSFWTRPQTWPGRRPRGNGSQHD
jgi:predicted dehydrogenase